VTGLIEIALLSVASEFYLDYFGIAWDIDFPEWDILWQISTLSFSSTAEFAQA